VAELEEENSQLKRLLIAVTVLRRALDDEPEIYLRLKNSNDSLLEERKNVRYRVANLESELARSKTNAAARLGGETSGRGGSHCGRFRRCRKICLPISDGAPSVEDYVCAAG
jgi:hypothetical protein